MIASPNVFWGGAIVAAFAAGGIVWLASSDYRVAYAKIFRQKKWPSLQEAFELLLPAGILIVLAILVAAQITVASHSKPQTSSVVTIAKLPPYSGNSLDNTILLDCEWVVYPTVIPQNGLYDMELIADSPMLGAVVGPSAFPPGSPIKKQDPNDGPDYTYRCQFSNFGDKPLLKVAADLTLQFKEVLKDSRGIHSGHTVKSGVVASPILSLGTGANNSFEFFVQNFSDNAFANVIIPRTVLIEAVRSDQWQTVKLAPPNLGGFGMPPFVRPKKP